MSRKLLSIVLLCLCLPAISTSARAESADISHQESAGQMVAYCSGFAKSLSGDRVSSPINFDSGMCWGAFAALQQAISLVSTSENIHDLGVCAPTSNTRSQLIEIFVTYAKQHPERYHEVFFLVALDATQKAFPCSR